MINTKTVIQSNPIQSFGVSIATSHQKFIIRVG
jgi:hypothetical protein